MQVKGKHRMRAIDAIATDAMMVINDIYEADVRESNPYVAIHAEKLYNISQGYIMLYQMLMEAKQMPTPSNTRRFPEAVH